MAAVLGINFVLMWCLKSFFEGYDYSLPRLHHRSWLISYRPVLSRGC